MTKSEIERAREGINREINQCHSNLLNALADLALDDGDEELAAAYRWMAEHHKWPVEANDTFYWSYYQRSRSSSPPGWKLPGNLPRPDSQDCLSMEAAIHQGARMVLAYLKKGGK